jgi:hypothetical protein
MTKAKQVLLEIDGKKELKVVKKGKTIKITLGDEKNIQQVINSEGLFWNDLYYYSSGEDGWDYLHDANTNTVYPLNDYGYDHIKTLLDKGSVTLKGVPNDDTYADYEWNKE